MIELCLEKGSNQNLVLKKLQKGENFGESPFFFGNTHQETARSLGFSTLYKVTHKELLEYLSNFPKDKERFCELKDKSILNKEVNSSFRGCLSCSKRTHLIDECPLLIYCPDKQFLIERLNFSKPQKRACFNRNLIKSNTFKMKAKTACNVMKVRFDKSLMNHYYSNIQSQTQGDLPFLENGVILGISETMKASLPFRSYSLDLSHCNTDLIKLNASFLSLRSMSEIEDFGPQSGLKSTIKSFCPSKDEINLMFKRDEDEGINGENDILKKLRKKEELHQNESNRNFSFSSRLIFDKEHSEGKKRILISNLRLLKRR